MSANENLNNLIPHDEHSTKQIDLFFNKIGYSRYQILCYITLFLILYTDSLQMLHINYIANDVKIDLNLQMIHTSLIKTAVYVGIALGTFFCSKLIDKYGRKRFIFIGAGIMFVFSLLIPLSVSYIDFIIYRFLIGIGIGIQMPAGMNLVSESIPIKYRSVFLSTVWISFGCGESTSILLCWKFLPDYRTIQFIIATPMIITLTLAFFLYESPRFLYAHKRYNEGAEVLKKIEDFNNLKEELLNDDILEQIIIEYDENKLNDIVPKFSAIFEKKYLGLTLKTWALWSSGNIGLYLGSFMVPKLLGETNKNQNPNYWTDCLISSAITTPSCILAGVLAERLGRKYSMFVLSITAIISSVLLLYTDWISNILLGTIKLLSGTIVAIIKVYSTEAFPTKLRGIGSSSGHAVGRFMTILTPFISDYFVELFFLKSPFYVFLAFHGLGAICAITLPFETRGRELDKDESEKQTIKDKERNNQINDIEDKSFQKENLIS